MAVISPTGKPSRKDLFAVWLSAAVFLILPIILLVSGFHDAQHQYYVNATYLPVDATVISTTVDSYKPSKGARHYFPKITYAYVVNDKRYQSDHFRPVSTWGDEDWANSIVAKYPVEQTCRAFYDPANPAEAVLIKSQSFGPYFDSLEAVLFLAIGAVITLSTWFQRTREPVPADNGWFEIAPKFSERARLLVAVYAAAIWYGLGALVAAHYFYCVRISHASISLHLLEGFAALGLIPLAFVVHYFRVTRNSRDARLLLDNANPTPGKKFNFTVTQPALRPLSLSSVRVSLRCTGVKARGKSRDRTVLHEEYPVELKNQALHLGESLELSGSLTIKPDLPPSGRDPSRKFNWIEWEMALRCDVTDAPNYNIRFPLAVHPASIETMGRVPTQVPSAEARVQPIDSRFTAGALAKWSIALAYLIGLFPIWMLLLGIVLMTAAYPIVFKDPTFHPLFLLPTELAMPAFAIGAGLALVVMVQLFVTFRPENLLLRWRIIRAIGRRSDAILKPGAEESYFVDIIPRSHWNRLMLENASDVGFVTIDSNRREVLFEGDRERYRIPAGAILSCTLEKSFYTETANADAPGTWLVVIRAYRQSQPWEVPFAIRRTRGRAVVKNPSKITNTLYEQIRALVPTTAENNRNTLGAENSSFQR